MINLINYRSLIKKIIKEMKQNQVIQENLLKSVKKIMILFETDEFDIRYLNLVSYMLSTIVLIGNIEDARQIVNMLIEKYNADESFKGKSR